MTSGSDPSGQPTPGARRDKIVALLPAHNHAESNGPL